MIVHCSTCIKYIQRGYSKTELMSQLRIFPRKWRGIFGEVAVWVEVWKESRSGMERSEGWGTDAIPGSTLGLTWDTTGNPRRKSLGNQLRFFFIKMLFIYFFRERGKEREREGEKHQCVVAFYTPPTGDLAHTPGAAQCSIHWATPARAQLRLLKMAIMSALFEHTP